jgi:hypothetical protein
MKNKTEMENLSAAAWSDTGRCGDEYYAKMSAWVVSDRRDGTATECSRLANVYDQMPHSPASVRRMDLAVTYKSILSGDLEYFVTHPVYGPQLLHE